jgi:predicted aminopeptidase
MDRLTFRHRLAAGILVLALAGCQSAGYYGQAVWGQAQIMAARQPIADLLDDPETPPAVKEQLSDVLALTHFAHTELGLPAGNSYRSFARIDRPWAVWNVFAAPEFSLAPKTWCYPVAGCAAYRGYFSEAAARRFAADLAAEGYDVFVTGVLAYSTLGWFEDPVLSTFLRLDRPQMAALIFHELAHGLLFVPGDTEFNESFASAVEAEGLRRWTAASRAPEVLDAYHHRQSLQDTYIQLVLRRKAELAALYAAGLPAQSMRARKAEILAGLNGDWERMRQSQPGLAAYAGWFAAGRNNAGLAVVSAYHGWVPAFERLLSRSGGDLAEFYRRSRELAQCPDEERRHRLQLLLAPDSAPEGPDRAACGAR